MKVYQKWLGTAALLCMTQGVEAAPDEECVYRATCPVQAVAGSPTFAYEDRMTGKTLPATHILFLDATGKGDEAEIPLRAKDAINGRIKSKKSKKTGPDGETLRKFKPAAGSVDEEAVRVHALISQGLAHFKDVLSQMRALNEADDVYTARVDTALDKLDSLKIWVLLRRAGESPNAYFRPEGDDLTLTFLLAEYDGRLTNSAKDPDVVWHELGHLLLHTLFPELLDMGAPESAAFHEAFGDLMATSFLLSLKEGRNLVVQQMREGKGLNAARQIGEGFGVDLGMSTLRDVGQNIRKSDAGEEEHDLSQSLTSALWDVGQTLMAEQASLAQGQQVENWRVIKHTSRFMMGLVLDAVLRNQDRSPLLFSHVAATMLQTAKAAKKAEGLPAALREVHLRRALKAELQKNGIQWTDNATMRAKDVAATLANHPRRVCATAFSAPSDAS